MEQHKIVRTVCVFTKNVTPDAPARLDSLARKLAGHGFTVQTQRLCSPDHAGVFGLDSTGDGSRYLSLGQLSYDRARAVSKQFRAAKNVALNVELGDETLTGAHVELLTDIIRTHAAKTFNFTYTFNNVPSSPYFPSAAYERDGFAVGLQPTDLAAGCATVAEWLEQLAAVWAELDDIFADDAGYLGVDTSIAPLFAGDSSFVHFIRRTGLSFSAAVTTDLFVRITSYIKASASRKVGLCGLMLPCLEDFALAEEYAAGNFSIERNIFLSLHSGLGIDTYPIGVDERPERILEILKLVQALSNKYGKPLSARFVSDGSATIGQRTSFGNQYLKDVTIRPL